MKNGTHPLIGIWGRKRNLRNNVSKILFRSSVDKKNEKELN